MKLKINKKLFYKIHLWIGVKLSILFFIVCFSGTLAVFSHEMDWLFIPEIRATPTKELASRNLIVSNIKKKYPNGTITYWMKADESYLCDIVYVEENEKQTYVFANRYTGEVQGNANITIQRFFRDLHYFLFIPFQVGNYTVLFFGFVLLVSLVTALFFYKKWWRKLFLLQVGKGTVPFFKSLHRLVGLWSVPFSLLFSITGIWYFVERANVAGVDDMVDPNVPEVVLAESDEQHSYDVDYDKAIAKAKEEIPTLIVGGISPPDGSDGIIYMRGKSHVPLVRERANRVYLNAKTFEPIYVQRAEDINIVMWINDIADPLHYGNWGGLVTKFIWFVMGLGISSLILSGIWITLKREASRRRKVKKKVIGIWKYINWAIYGAMLYFMYVKLISRYNASTTAIVVISLTWSLLIFLTYYLFVYRIGKSVKG